MIKLLAAVLISIIAGVTSQSAPMPVTVSELIAHPSDHYDQRLLVTGVLAFNSDGSLICEMPSRMTAPRHESCIDIASSNWPYARFDWSKKGAVISITGYFSFTCPNPTVENEDGVMTMCLHRGWQGYINVESVSIVGYATCADDCAPHINESAREISAADPATAGIAEFARALVSAARSRSSDRVAAITLPSMRTEMRFDLEPRASFDRYLSELANAPAWVTEPGRGFRLFDIDKDDYTVRHHELCFCIKGDCASRWREATADDDHRMFRCHYIWRDANSWYLLY